MAEEYGFTVVDADQSIKDVFDNLKTHVQAVVAEMIPGRAFLDEFVEPVIPIERESPTERRSMAETLRDFFSSLLEDN